MQPVRTALIGCGKVGRTHAEALATLPESQFVAVCDADARRAQSFAADYGAAAFTDLAAMLEQSAVEALCICTPHPLHAGAVIAAAGHGVHALVEKPLAATLTDCDAMIAAADSAGVRLGVVSQRRLYAPVQRMKAAIDAGKIGRPALGTLLMLSWRDAAYYDSDPWRGTWTGEGGGVLVNQAPHQLDILQWLMGPIAEITGYVGNLNHPTIEVEDTASASIRFRSGALGSIIASNSQKPGIYSKVHIHGDNGASVGVQTDGGATFIAGMTGVQEPPVTDLWTIPGETHLLDSFVQADRDAFTKVDTATYYHRLQIQDFLHTITEDRPPLVTGAEGRIVVEMFTALYRSNGQPVRFPVAAQPDEPGTHRAGRL